MCLLGRWVLHLPAGTFVHRRIGDSAPKRGECAAGWIFHYLIGVSLAVGFVLVAPAGWLDAPTPVAPLTYGVVTTVMPYFILQPALGLGIASSRAPNPAGARLKSLMTHTVFGVGLYLSATLLRWASS